MRKMISTTEIKDKINKKKITCRKINLEADEFERPSDFNWELDCDKVKKENSGRDNYRRERY